MTTPSLSECSGKTDTPGVDTFSARLSSGEEAVIAALFSACEHSGSMRAFAWKKGLPVSLVSATLSGKRRPNAAIANAVGYARRVTFHPMMETQDV